MAVASYRFFPWVQSGLTSILDEASPSGRRAVAKVRLAITPEVARERTIELLGPGDVAGIDTRFIVRTDPRPSAQLVEPNYLASIEFDRPDFPWMLTPHGPGNKLQLQPWLVLVVLDRDRVGDPQIQPGNPLPVIKLEDEALISEELPKLADSWAWAHAQRLSLGESDDEGELERNPDANVSRLLCPRRLSPNRRWIACLVPAFEIGRAAGLGLPPAEGAAAAPAWDDRTKEIVLPLYFHWTFETGPDGDFEKLASLLKPNKAAGEGLEPETARRARAFLGAADDSSTLRTALAPTDPSSCTRIDAVLETLDREPQSSSDLPAAITAALQKATASLDEDGRAILSPPLSGSRIIERDGADPTKINESWFDELNLDPRTRVAARVGADGIRAFQEELMQAAWEQVGNVLDANAQLDRSRFFAAVAKRGLDRHITPLKAERQLAILAPAFGRARVADGNTSGIVRRTSLPDRTFDAALRRLTSATSRPSRAIARLRATAPERISAPPFLDLPVMLQRAREEVDPGDRERDGITSFAFAQRRMERDGNDATIALPGGETIKARALASAPPSAGERLTLRSDLAEGVLSDRNRLEILELAEKNGLDVRTVETAARKAATGGERDSILVVRRAGSKIVADPLLRGLNGEVRLVSPDGPRTLFTLQSDDEPDDLTVARLAFNVPRNVETGSNLTVLLRDNHGTTVASYARASFSNLGGATAAERLRRKKRAIREAHAGAPAEEVGSESSVLGTLSAPLRGAAVAAAIGRAFEGAFGGLAAPSDLKFVPFDLEQGPASPLTMITNAVEPARSFRERVGVMVKVPDWIVGRADVFDPVRAAPDFQAALAIFLAKSGPDAFVPRDVVLPNDSVSALQTNPRFEAAALVGANHEINRELLWRTYPTDGRGTSLRRFWAWFDPDRDDIDAIATWPGQGLLKDRLLGAKGNLVVAIRGRLLQRYPNTIIFLWKAAGDESLAAIPADPAQRDTVIRDAQFRQFVGPDLTLTGFDLSPQEFAQGWFLVLQEPISESRFGLDEEGTLSDGRRNINGGNWGTMTTPPGAYLAAEKLGQNATSATIANSLLQRPVRVAIHSNQLTPALG